MNRCPQCNVMLYHNPGICPLCSCVTEDLGAEEEKELKKLFGHSSPYPNARGRNRLLRFILRLVLFIFVIAEAVMIVINYFTNVTYPWSLITGVSLLYIYLFLVYWISHDAGFAAKVGLQMLITMIFLYEIDALNGMRGWSLQWAIPSIILLGDGLVFLLMMLNRSRWQSYMLLLLFMGICSLVIMAFYFLGKIGSVVMPLICLFVSSFYFFGAMLFGGKAAGREFRRRFHI